MNIAIFADGSTLVRLMLLQRRSYLALMDLIYNTNPLKWKRFTIVTHSEHGRWLPCAHILSPIEDDNIVTASLRKVKEWCRRRDACGFAIWLLLTLPLNKRPFAWSFESWRRWLRGGSFSMPEAQWANA